MAFSDYGAYIWKNGIDITKECADFGYTYINNKWVRDIELCDIEVENLPNCGGHANLLLGDFCIEFLKTYNPIIVFNNGERTKIELEDTSTYKNTELNLEIIAFALDDNERIWAYTIKFKNDYYYVVVGSCFGYGWDKQKVSKYIKKYVYFDTSGGINHGWDCRYFINTTRNVYIVTVMNKLIRKDDLNFTIWSLWRFDIKPMLKDLIRFKFRNVAWHFNEALDRIVEIYYLK